MWIPPVNGILPPADLFDMFLETVLRDVPHISIEPDTLAVDESEPGKFNLVNETQISLKSAFHDLAHHSIHPVPAKRYTMGAIVEILQRLVVQYDTFLYRFLETGKRS
jgi:hypothetical protein